MIFQVLSLRGKCPSTEFFSGPYFPVFALNTGKYGPEKTLSLGTFCFPEIYKNRGLML